MPGGFRKTWRVRSWADAVQRILKTMPRVYEDGNRDGIIGWVGRTYSHQRRDVKSKPPRLMVEKEGRLVFQHDLVSPLTYSLELADAGAGTTEVRLEVRTSSTHKDTQPADQVIALCYTLTKALEPLDP